MRNLRGTPDRQRLVRLAVLGDHAARFYRVGSESLVNHALLDHNAAISFGLLENFVDVVGRWCHAECNVGAELFIQ